MNAISLWLIVFSWADSDAFDDIIPYYETRTAIYIKCLLPSRVDNWFSPNKMNVGWLRVWLTVALQNKIADNMAACKFLIDEAVVKIRIFVKNNEQNGDFCTCRSGW